MFRNIPKKLLIVCILLTIGSLAVFLIALLACPHPLDKTLLIIASLLILGLAGLIVYYNSLLDESIPLPHYFLFDETTKKNLTPEQLTFSRVNAKTGLYIEQNFASPRVLWMGNGLSAVSKFGNNAVFRTLVVYKMLYDVISHDIPKLWKIFWHVPPTTINALCTCLNQNDDAPISKRLRGYLEAGEDSVGELRKYFLSNTF